MNPGLSGLEEVLTLSEQMVGAARSGDWQELTRLEDRRRALAGTLPADLGQHLRTAEQARARRLIEASRHCDDQVRPLVTARLKELRTLLRAAEPAS
mgnify:FL=1